MPELNIRPDPDQVLVDIADFVIQNQDFRQPAYTTARYCLMDALGCAIAALDHPACTRLLGPLIPGTIVPNGSRVPGTGYLLDPVQAAFNLGSMIRWLDYNDTWLAAEWGHPSDNLGGILMTADWLSRSRKVEGAQPLRMKDILTALIQAYEIQGILGLENSFNQVGLDHVLLVKVATTAVTAQMLGCSREQLINALSNAWIDGQALRTYRHMPNTGSRKSWAAGDATSRGVRLALMARQGEMGYPSALSAKIWGFYAVLFKGQTFCISREYDSYVVENILFKVSFPAEFHAQTAVEAAFLLHPQVKDRLDQIERVVISTEKAALRIIDKRGPLYNPADRDHCIQYMTAVGMIYGTLSAGMYEDDFAADPMIDTLREKMDCVEDPRYSQDYLDPEKRSIANAVQVFFQDGSQTEKIEVEYPAGHRRRRNEAIPLLEKKFFTNTLGKLPAEKQEALASLFNDPDRLDQYPVDEFVNLFLP